MHLFSRRFVYLLSAVVVTVTGGLAQAPRLVESPKAASPISIRLMFGLDRFTPQRWDGSLNVTSGQVLQLSGVHFEGRDRIVEGASWLLSNRVTRYADSTTQRGFDPVHTRQFAMIPNGVAGTLDAAETSGVNVITEQGAYSFGNYIRDCPKCTEGEYQTN